MKAIEIQCGADRSLHVLKVFTTSGNWDYVEIDQGVGRIKIFLFTMMRTVVCNERRRVMVIVCSYCQSISVFRISLSQSINEFFCYQLIR